MQGPRRSAKERERGESQVRATSRQEPVQELRIPVTLSEAKGLVPRITRFFAALRMTALAIQRFLDRLLARCRADEEVIRWAK